MYSDDDTRCRVGCPIRISTDQSLLAAPHGFSQRATSFIASWYQGIHRMPLSRSIPKQCPYKKHRPALTMYRNHHTHQISRPNRLTLNPLHSKPYTQHSIYKTPLNTDTIQRGTILGTITRTTIPSGQTITIDSIGPTHSSPFEKPPSCSYAPRDAPEPDSQHQRTNNTQHPALSAGADPTTLSHETCLSMGLCPKPHQRTVVLWTPVS